MNAMNDNRPQKRRTTLIVEMSKAELACRILEGMMGQPRPAGFTAQQALASLDRNTLEGILRACAAATGYFAEQMKKGVVPS